jgi:branched-subunit amino acid transport protein
MRVWLTILLLTGGTYVLKAAGPLLLGGRRLPGLVDEVARLLPAALLAALVATGTAAAGQEVVVDARMAGLGAAAVALWRRAGFLTTVVVAMAATALVRALG